MDLEEDRHHSQGSAQDAIRSDFIPDILGAAEAAEVFVERVVITLRRP